MALTIRERLIAHAQVLSELSNPAQKSTAVAGYLIGAIFSLLHANELRYIDGELDDEAYTDELKAIAQALANSNLHPTQVPGVRISSGVRTDIPGIWLAGYYFNSAIQRIAATADRLGIHRKHGNEPVRVGAIREDVNKLKHAITGLLSNRKTKSIEDAVEAVDLLINVIKIKKLL